MTLWCSTSRSSSSYDSTSFIGLNLLIGAAGFTIPEDFAVGTVTSVSSFLTSIEASLVVEEEEATQHLSFLKISYKAFIGSHGFYVSKNSGNSWSASWCLKTIALKPLDLFSVRSDSSGSLPKMNLCSLFFSERLVSCFSIWIFW